MEQAFDHEKLDVYRIELQFIAWLTDFFLEVSQSRAARCRELFEQLDRASLSALLNTAEGNGKRQGRQRAKFFDDARGSAIECAACLDAAVAKRFVSPDRIQPAGHLIVLDLDLELVLDPGMQGNNRGQSQDRLLGGIRLPRYPLTTSR